MTCSFLDLLFIRDKLPCSVHSLTVANTCELHRWDEVIPRLIGYLEKNGPSDKWDQQAWEDLVLKLLSRTLDAVDDEDWVLKLGRALGKQFELYGDEPDSKNMLSKCLGTCQYARCTDSAD